MWLKPPVGPALLLPIWKLRRRFSSSSRRRPPTWMLLKPLVAPWFPDPIINPDGAPHIGAGAVGAVGQGDGAGQPPPTVMPLKPEVGPMLPLPILKVRRRFSGSVSRRRPPTWMLLKPLVAPWFPDPIINPDGAPQLGVVGAVGQGDGAGQPPPTVMPLKPEVGPMS